MKSFTLENQQVNFGPPGREDFEALMAFFQEVIAHTFAKNGLGDEEAMIAEEIEDKREKLLEAIDTGGKAHCLIIGKLNDRIICSIGIGKTGNLIESCTKGELVGVPEICTVFVKPEFQAKGLSGHLLNLALGELRSRGQEAYCLDSGYKTAQKIWTKKLGTPTYVIKDYWEEGNDHMIWYRKVTE